MSRGGKVSVRITDKGLQQSMRKVFGPKASVTVGVFGEKGDEPSGEGSLTVAEIAAIHEFGLGGMPERSFIRSYFDAELPKIQGALLALIRAKLSHSVKTGTPVTAKDQKEILDKIGLYMVGRIQQRIAAGEIVPELAQSTIDRKGSSTPLIDTGQLRSSISHEVEL